VPGTPDDGETETPGTAVIRPIENELVNHTAPSGPGFLVDEQPETVTEAELVICPGRRQLVF
jgi:hypothetical protein